MLHLLTVLARYYVLGCAVVTLPVMCLYGYRYGTRQHMTDAELDDEDGIRAHYTERSEVPEVPRVID